MEIDIFIQKLYFLFDKIQLPQINIGDLIASAAILFTIGSILSGITVYAFRTAYAFYPNIIFRIIKSGPSSFFAILPIFGFFASLVYSCIVLGYCAILNPRNFLYWLAFVISIILVFSIFWTIRWPIIAFRIYVHKVIFENWKRQWVEQN